jgi:hypothetical protein
MKHFLEEFIDIEKSNLDPQFNLDEPESCDLCGKSFSDEEFFSQIANLGERYSKSTELKNMNGNRGSKHFIYINRTFFGLYNLMHDLKAKKVKINNFIQY